MQLLFYNQLFGEIVAVCCGNFWKQLSGVVWGNSGCVLWQLKETVKWCCLGK